MSAAILLDAGPLGLLSNPHGTPSSIAARAWLLDLHQAGFHIIVPEITDFEVRRKLVRGQRFRAVTMLDALGATYDYLPITTVVFRRAADLWADARNLGLPTASLQALDCDVILAAQFLELSFPAIIATINRAHLSRYAPAELWTNIVP